nr:immunoglobulin light chain junction region [Macaca mulatta]
DYYCLLSMGSGIVLF